MVGCVLSQLKPSKLYILSFAQLCRKVASVLFKANNVELLGLINNFNPEFTIIVFIHYTSQVYASGRIVNLMSENGT